MPRDERTYITLHDGMPEHPKVDPLSDAAFRLVVDLWCWCSRNRTDGRVKIATWNKRGTPKARREIIDAGLAEMHDDHVDMHDYLEHQRSAAEIDELREKRRAAGSKGGKAKANGLASATASAIADAEQTGSKSVAESETEVPKQSLGTNARSAGDIKSTTDPRFVEFWTVYPLKQAKGSAMKALSAALRIADIDTIVGGAKRYRDDPRRKPDYTAHASTWLNQRRWEDEGPAEAPPLNGSRPAVYDAAWEAGM